MKRAIVIGATSGIGRGLAEKLAEKNYKVGITGRREPLLLELQKENPEHFLIKTFDIKEVQSIPMQLQSLVNELGGLDLLIINSGTGHRNISLDFEKEEHAILTNVHGFTAIADWAYNYFQEQKQGHLAAISSIAGIRGNRFAPAYCASKSYQISYMQALRQKSKKENDNILITDIRPGFVDTAMAQGENVFWKASVEKATRQIISALENKKEIVYITKRWRIIGFLIPLIPRRLYEKI